MRTKKVSLTHDMLLNVYPPSRLDGWVNEKSSDLTQSGVALLEITAKPQTPHQARGLADVLHPSPLPFDLVLLGLLPTTTLDDQLAIADVFPRRPHPVCSTVHCRYTSNGEIAAARYTDIAHSRAPFSPRHGIEPEARCPGTDTPSCPLLNVRALQSSKVAPHVPPAHTCRAAALVSTSGRPTRDTTRALLPIIGLQPRRHAVHVEWVRRRRDMTRREVPASCLRRRRFCCCSHPAVGRRFGSGLALPVAFSVKEKEGGEGGATAGTHIRAVLACGGKIAARCRAGTAARSSRYTRLERAPSSPWLLASSQDSAVGAPLKMMGLRMQSCSAVRGRERRRGRGTNKGEKRITVSAFHVRASLSLYPFHRIPSTTISILVPLSIPPRGSRCGTPHLAVAAAPHRVSFARVESEEWEDKEGERREEEERREKERYF
ncbi:hypothetical protein C8R47DRAFT_1064160 [Mycena vitilis]|nr:hypothetical protein C8R47DRAFT_1064160 [Mycena vitilis]